MNYESLEDAEMRALARELGADAAARVDVERTAQAVVRRLRDEPRVVGGTRPLRAWLSLAAAVVLMLGGGLVWRHGRRPVAGTELAPAGLDLNTLSAEQLHEVLNAVDQPLDVEPAGAAEAGLDDLTPPELRALLRALEG